jgi:hypothetical protein
MGWVVNATSRPLYGRERPGTQFTGGWLDPRTGPDGCGKSRPPLPPPGFDPLTVQPGARHDTDRAIPARQVNRRVEYDQVLIKYVFFFQPKSWMAKNK